MTELVNIRWLLTSTSKIDADWVCAVNGVAYPQIAWYNPRDSLATYCDFPLLSPVRLVLMLVRLSSSGTYSPVSDDAPLALALAYGGDNLKVEVLGTGLPTGQISI